MLKANKKAASEVLEDVVRDNTADQVTLFELKNALHERGFGLLLIIFALPALIPVPGITAVLGIPLILFSLQMLLGFDSPWLPRWLGEKAINRSTLSALIEKSAPKLRRIEGILRPRLTFACSPGGEKFVGLCCFIFAVIITLPLVFGNALPSIGIMLMSLGLLSRDGIMVILGILVGFVGVFLALAVVFLGIGSVKLLLNHWF